VTQIEAVILKGVKADPCVISDILDTSQELVSLLRIRLSFVRLLKIRKIDSCENSLVAVRGVDGELFNFKSLDPSERDIVGFLDFRRFFPLGERFLLTEHRLSLHLLLAHREGECGGKQS